MTGWANYDLVSKGRGDFLGAKLIDVLGIEVLWDCMGYPSTSSGQVGSGDKARKARKARKAKKGR